MKPKLYFSRKIEVYHFYLFEGNKIKGKITSKEVSFKEGDVFRIMTGEFSGTYIVKSIDQYKKVRCKLI